MTTLERASHEWSSRSADERFGSLAALHADALLSHSQGAEATVFDRDMHVIEHEGAVMLNGKTGNPARLTNWTFGQVCREAGAPTSYLGGLSASTAVAALNEGFAKNDTADRTTKILFNRGPRKPTGTAVVPTVRALTSERYSRIWDADITKRLVALEKQGPWQPAPEAFDGSRGLYRGDRDMFAFMVDNERRIFEKGPGGGLGRGFFCWNSEVGAASFGIMSFLYEYVCGNHRVWGASNIKEFRIRHIGDADERGFAEFKAILTKYADSSVKDDEAKITAARSYSFGATKDEVLDKVFGLKIADLSQTVIEAGYEKAIEHEDWYGNPQSAWGLAGGITEIARDLPNADTRDKVDRAASKLMEIAF